MATIDVGPGAVNLSSNYGSGSPFTWILKDNPANADGVINTISIFAYNAMSGIKVGIFYLVSGSTYATRSWTTLANIPGAGLNIQTVSDLAIQTGDLIGLYWTSGDIEFQTSGGVGSWYTSGDHVGGSAVYNSAGYLFAIYGEYIAPPVPTIGCSTGKLISVGIL